MGEGRCWEMELHSEDVEADVYMRRASLKEETFGGVEVRRIE